MRSEGLIRRSSQKFLNFRGRHRRQENFPRGERVPVAQFRVVNAAGTHHDRLRTLELEKGANPAVMNDANHRGLGGESMHPAGPGGNERRQSAMLTGPQASLDDSDAEFISAAVRVLFDVPARGERAEQQVSRGRIDAGLVAQLLEPERMAGVAQCVEERQRAVKRLDAPDRGPLQFDMVNYAGHRPLPLSKMVLAY